MSRPSPQSRQLDVIVRLLDEIEDLGAALIEPIEHTSVAADGHLAALSRRRQLLEERLSVALSELQLIDEVMPACDHRLRTGEARCAPIVTLTHRSTMLRHAIELHQRRVRELGDGDHLGSLDELVAHTFALEHLERELVPVEALLRHIRLSYADDGRMLDGEPTIPQHICPLQPPGGVMSPRKREAVIRFGLNRPLRVIAREMDLQAPSVSNLLTLAQDDWGVSREALGIFTAEHFRLVGCPHLDDFLSR